MDGETDNARRELYLETDARRRARQQQTARLLSVRDTSPTEPPAAAEAVVKYLARYLV